ASKNGRREEQGEITIENARAADAPPRRGRGRLLMNVAQMLASSPQLQGGDEVRRLFRMPTAAKGSSCSSRRPLGDK
ncbi:MAG: hypothetical protein IKI07_01565, partial [Prevotella sp.]|nr:hypothetical protein [Prevotella sp.]